MKTLLLLRHAKSSRDEIAVADHDRPLNKRGRRDAPRMGRLLREEGIVPDLVLCSTAERARETARAVAEASGFSGETRLERTLYLAGPSRILATLQGLPPEVKTAMVVGHNPGLEELLGLLTGEEERFPTAALARIALPLKTWKDLDPRVRGKLMSLWRPKEVE